jgi:hypothetical protein
MEPIMEKKFEKPELGQTGGPEFWYAPVFFLNQFRFVWFNRAIIAETPEEAKKIGLKLEEGYIKNNVPIVPARTVAKFATTGHYVLAELGPEGDERPVVVLNPLEVIDMEQVQKNNNSFDAAEEIPYDTIIDDGFIKSVSF